MQLFHVLLLAALQGVTELFPISSLGHAILFLHWIGWTTDIKSPTILPFLVALHLGTATALLIYFWQDWWGMLKFKEIHPVFKKPNQTIIMYLVAGTIPPAIAGVLLEKKMDTLFGSSMWVAIFLLLNGVMLIAAEFLKRKHPVDDLKSFDLKHALVIGSCQILALFPGFSRSGSTLVGGLLQGFDHETAAHFSFLLATPLIFAAGVYEIPKLFHSDVQTIILPIMLGALTAGIFAYLSVAFLMRYMKEKETKALIPFGIYCLVIGALTLVIK